MRSSQTFDSKATLVTARVLRLGLFSCVGLYTLAYWLIGQAKSW